MPRKMVCKKIQKKFVAIPSALLQETSVLFKLREVRYIAALQVNVVREIALEDSFVKRRSRSKGTARGPGAEMHRLRLLSR